MDNQIIPGNFAKVFITLFGIITPVIAIIVELMTGICREVFFDPLPTLFHVAAYAIIPVSNTVSLHTLIKKKQSYLTKTLILNGLSIGISFFYTLIFLPILPLSLLAIIFFGIGLLSLSPLTSLISSLLLFKNLNRFRIEEQDKKSSPILWKSILAGILLIILIDLPINLTHIGIRMAMSPSKDTELRGLKFLRIIGDEDLLLRMCYHRSGRMTNITGFIMAFFSTPDTADIRTIFYRVTGKAFNSLPYPDMDGEFTWRGGDSGIGGDVVGEKTDSLSLYASRIDGSIDSDAFTGYLEWTMVFKNNSQMQQEARAEIKLPPTSVVSRLTLWVDGQEREAAFAKTNEVKTAYKNIVRKMRDPVLVTTRGIDRIMVQCFPVPVKGEMKIRVGITLPLVPGSLADSAYATLPIIEKSNFIIPEKSTHSVWIASKNRFISTSSASLKLLPEKDDSFSLKGSISDEELSKTGITYLVKRNMGITKVAAQDTKAAAKHFITQELISKTSPPPSRVAIVIDGSMQVKNFIPSIVSALEYFNEHTEIAIFLASDTLENIIYPAKPANSTLFKQISEKLNAHDFEGGKDNLPALIKAWSYASEKENRPGGWSALLWLHGPQPILISPIETLNQQIERSLGKVTFLSLQLTHGTNRVLEKLVPNRETIATSPYGKKLELKQILSQNLQPKFALRRQKTQVEVGTDLENHKETSSHLVRLWAYKKIMDTYFKKDPSKRTKAIAMALKYQLVTPFSGAVVLENAKQYKEAGLKPVDPESVPTIPEPEIIFLLSVVLFLLLIMFIQKKRGRFR